MRIRANLQGRRENQSPTRHMRRDLLGHHVQCVDTAAPCCVILLLRAIVGFRPLLYRLGCCSRPQRLESQKPHRQPRVTTSQLISPAF